MKEIPLTQGLVTQVDDWNYDLLNNFKWFAKKGRDTYYAVRNIRKKNGKHTTIQMHRVIMKTPKHLQCDHENHNGLDNQESNLRDCTNPQNRMNAKPYGKSKYKGVTISFVGQIHAQITVNGKHINLGYTKTEEEAAKLYDIAALKYNGKFANLNFKENAKAN